MAKNKRCPSQNKQCYRSQIAAIRAALSYSRKRGTPLRPYFHKECKSWHVTKQPRRIVTIATEGVSQ